MPHQKPNEILIQEELEWRILHGLACEWEEAIWDLPSFHRDRINKPLFSLQDMTSKWGYWSEERNEICLSRNLVLNHSWDTVCEILRHEMAHQLTEQVLDAYDEPPHGPQFKKACELLKTNPKASGNYLPLDEQISKDSPNSEDKILLRVKKLMALAQSKNQHEAEAAMTKAHELIAKYNIDLLSRDAPRHFVSVFVGKPALRHFREEYYLSRLIQDYYFVCGIWIPAYVIEKGKMGRVLEISGTVQNVRIASYIHAFIKHFINARWKEYNREKGLTRYHKTDFAVGVIKGFRSKLELQTEKKNNVVGQQNLIKIKDTLLEKHYKCRYPRISNIKKKALRNNEHILKDGMDIGKNLVIHKGISNKGKGIKLLE